MAILFGSEGINAFGRKHWHYFSSQQYFDVRGAFLSVIIGAPLLVIQLLIVIWLLMEAAQLVVKLKRMEIKEDLLKRKGKKAE